MLRLRSAVAEARRQRLCARLPESPLRRLLREPPPEPTRDVREVAFLALDLETNGLNPKRDRVLSLGFVPLTGAQIDLAGAAHLLIRSDQGVAASATLHGLTDDALLGGLELTEALPQLLEALTGRVLLAHHAVIETRFLSAACRRLYGAPMLCPVVDTLRLQARLEARAARTPRDGDLRLGAARARFGLPRYRAHDALADALACAELFLAQTSELAPSAPLTLAQVQR